MNLLPAGSLVKGFTIYPMKAVRQLVLLCAVTLIIVMPVLSQTSAMNSYPSATATIFLDFDGEYVTGTSWNWGGPITAQSSGLSGNIIAEIFNRVAEDFRPFNLNVTTDSAVFLAAPLGKRTRLIITTSWQWYGRAGGVAFVGSFNSGDDTPAWIFSELLSFKAKYIAEACSHEAGHTLGLQHQSAYNASCGKITEYSEGQGEGEIGWAPIMGVGYYKNLTTWHTGPNSVGCNVIQNDLDIIAKNNNINFRTDDHANSMAGATSIQMPALQFVVNGLINEQRDIDVFKLNLQSPSKLSLNAIPENVGLGNQGADIDIKVMILNAAHDTIGTYNPSAFLDAGIDTNLNSGDYYIVVKPTGNINHSDYGSLGYYSLRGALALILPLHQFVLKGNSLGGSDVLSWSYISDEPVRNIILESSGDGRKFQPLTSFNAITKNYSSKPIIGINFYRLKAVTLSGGISYYSNVISIHNSDQAVPFLVVSNPVRNSITIRSKAICDYRIYNAYGKLLLAGKIVSGINMVDIGNVSNGVLFFRLSNGVDNRTQKLIKQ